MNPRPRSKGPCCKGYTKVQGLYPFWFSAEKPWQRSSQHGDSRSLIECRPPSSSRIVRRFCTCRSCIWRWRPTLRETFLLSYTSSWGTGTCCSSTRRSRKKIFWITRKVFLGALPGTACSTTLENIQGVSQAIDTTSIGI